MIYFYILWQRCLLQISVAAAPAGLPARHRFYTTEYLQEARVSGMLAAYLAVTLWNLP